MGNEESQFDKQEREDRERIELLIQQNLPTFNIPSHNYYRVELTLFDGSQLLYYKAKILLNDEFIPSYEIKLDTEQWNLLYNIGANITIPNYSIKHIEYYIWKYRNIEKYNTLIDEISNIVKIENIIATNEFKFTLPNNQIDGIRFILSSNKEISSEYYYNEQPLFKDFPDIIQLHINKNVDIPDIPKNYFNL